VHHRRRIVPLQGGGELAAQLRRALEAAIGAEVLGPRAVERAGDVPGDRVQRFDLAAVALGGARVEQGLIRV